VADYLDESEPANIASLTYAEAKDLIEELEIDASQKAWEELDSEYIIDIGDWSELYPGLTDKRVQKAAKVLDEARPGWRNENNHIDLVIGKVGEQNPQLLERWQRKAEGKPRGSGRWSKNSGSGCSAVIFLAVVVWFIWKLASK